MIQWDKPTGYRCHNHPPEMRDFGKHSVTPVFTRKKGIPNLVLNKMEGSKDEHRKRAGGAPGSDV